MGFNGILEHIELKFGFFKRRTRIYKISIHLKSAKDLTFDSEYEPFFQQPGWIVAPIWAVLYTCLAVSFTTVLDRREELNSFSFIVAAFIIQLALNLAWPAVFNSERYLLSLVMLVFMIGFTHKYATSTYKTAPLGSYSKVITKQSMK